MARPISRLGLADDWHLPLVTTRGAWVDLAIIVLLGGVVGMLGGELLTVALLGLVQPELFDDPEAIMPGWAMIVAKAFWLACVLLVAYILQHRWGLSATVFGWPRRRDTVAKHALATLAALGAVGLAWIFAAGVAFAMVLLFPGLAEHDLEGRFETLSMIPRGPWYETAILMLLVGTQEELLFRGLLLPYLRRISGSWLIAVMISCVLFAVLHFPQGALAVIQIEFLALAFALVYILTRSMIAVSLAHFLFNFTQMMVVMPLIERQAELFQDSGLGP